MRMCYRMLIARLGYQCATIIRIQRMPEYIENEVTLTHKAYAERVCIFRLGCAAVCAAALKVEDGVKIRAVECMYVRIHYPKIIQSLLPGQFKHDVKNCRC